MTLVTLCMIAGLISFIVFIAKCNKKRSVTGVFIKNITSIFFVLTAAFGLLKSQNYEYGILVVVGLVFGMLGDIYLDQKWVYPKDMKQYLYAGFISFGIGHFFYMAAMIKHLYRLTALFNPKYLAIPVVFGLVVAVGNLLLEKPTKQKYGEYKIIVTIYSFVLATMVGVAVLGAITTAKYSGSETTSFNAFISFAIGGASFMISDLILSPMYFGEGKNTPLNFILNHATYYVGQFLIALSVAIIPVIK